MHVHIYQIDPDLDLNAILPPGGVDIIAANEGDFPSHIYKKVYSGELDVTCPEDVLDIFKLYWPAGYIGGRELGPLDVIEFVDAHLYYYYADLGPEFIHVDFDPSEMAPENRDLPF